MELPPLVVVAAVVDDLLSHPSLVFWYSLRKRSIRLPDGQLVEVLGDFSLSVLKFVTVVGDIV